MTGIKQSIADQTGLFSFQFNLTISDLTKNVNAGFSGLNNLNFNFYQGKIYDNTKNYCGSYSSNQNVFVSGDVNSNSYNYYINNEVVALGQPKSTGVINYFYVGSDSGNNVSYNVNLVGTAPNYLVSGQSFFITGNNATGYIFNQSSGNFQIFSGSCDNTNIQYISQTTGNISGNNSGIFVSFVTGATPGNSYSGNYTFYTNFGPITSPVTLIAENSLGFSYTSLNSSNFNGISAPQLITGYSLGGVSTFSVSGNSYIGAPFIKVSLTYISGYTGYFTGSLPISYLDTISITTGIQSGTLTAQISGSGIGSGIDGLGNIVTGLVSGLVSQNVFYTGNITGNYYINGSGLGSGVVNNSYGAQGTGTISGTGFVSGSANINLSGNIFGSGYDSSGIYDSGYFPYITTQSTYATGLNSVNVSFLGYGLGSGIENVPLISSGNYSGNLSLNITGSGFISGYLTGLISGAPSGNGSNFTIYSTGSGFRTGLLSATGTFSNYFYTTGSGQMTGYGNTGTGSGAINISYFTPISGNVTGLVTGLSGIGRFTGLAILTGAYSVMIQTGSNLAYTPPTGIIYYNTPQYQDTVNIAGTSFCYNYNYGFEYTGFTDLIYQINNCAAFHSAPGGSGYQQFTAVDSGDHNTIIVTATIPPSGLSPTYNYNLYANNSWSINIYYFFGGTPASGTMSSGQATGWASYYPSGSFTLYPSGNFYTTGTIPITGSGNYTGTFTGLLKVTGNYSGSGLWNSSGITMGIFTTGITSGNFGSFTINQIISGTTTGASGLSGISLVPFGVFTGNFFGAYTATGLSFIVQSGSYSGTIPVFTPYIAIVNGSLTGLVTGIANPANGNLYISYLPVTGVPISGTLNNNPTISAIGLFSGIINQSFYGSGIINTNISGLLTGSLNNQIIYNKTFLNTWNLNSGISQNTLINYQGQGNSTGYFNSGITNFSGNSFYIRIDYNPYSGTDMVLLTITGLNTGIQIPISGQII